MEWIGRRERLPITCLKDPPPMSSSYGAEELWHLTHGMRRHVLVESARDAQGIQEVDEELAIARRQIDNIDHQLYSHVRPIAEEGAWRMGGAATTWRRREDEAAWIWSANQGRQY
ncbi:hypothetical protein GIB67_029772 [Kingdonia uniflora]|uniref:Uncharacterized protein n=1 Tax=Kingdonia uniflora TaxID=39325 RepID=A0A7J7NJI4_9MAGN|nr:hypothetical protein GIB67_029772 [Kingdonia uniflora]